MDENNTLSKYVCSMLGLRELTVIYWCSCTTTVTTVLNIEGLKAIVGVLLYGNGRGVYKGETTVGITLLHNREH